MIAAKRLRIEPALTRLLRQRGVEHVYPAATCAPAGASARSDPPRRGLRPRREGLRKAVRKP
jgi:hypothetical protein